MAPSWVREVPTDIGRIIPDKRLGSPFKRVSLRKEAMPVNALCLNEQSRLLLVAPHPDDESLACSVILQRAVRARAAIKVIYATDGDNNLWPQRMVQRKWR